MRAIAVLMAGLLLVSAATARADEKKLVAALELFDAAALWSDGGSPRDGYEVAIGGVRRWNQTVRAFIGPSTTSNARTEAERRLREIAEITGVTFEIVDTAEKAVLKFEFLQEYQTILNMPQAGCVTQHRSRGGALFDVTVHIRLRQWDCVGHELMHAFGFGGHPHQLETVLSYIRRGNRSDGYTDLDRLILRALYRGKITPGMYHLPALVAARNYIAEDIGLAPPGTDASAFARAYLDKAVEKLRAEADTKKNAYIQMQLGNAYGFGAHVAVDPAEAARFWRLAADQQNSEAMYRLATAEIAGRGTQPDPASGRARLQAASALGHAQAALSYANAVRDGIGGPADAIEAFAYFDLAARRKVSAAGAARDSIAGALSSERRALADTRARELPTEPPR